MTIHDEHRQSSNFIRFSWVDTPGDRFIALSYRPGYGVESRWTHDDLIRDLEQLFRNTGPTEPCYEGCFAGLDDPIAVKHRLEYKNVAPSSVEIIRDSTIRRQSLASLPEACPPLDSDHGGSSDGTEDGDATTTPEVASGERSSLSHEDQSIYTTLRRVFSSEPSFSERLIAAVNRLPTDKREFLIGYDTECVDGSSSGPSKSGDRPPKKRRTLGNPSNQGGNGSRPNGDGGARGTDGEDDGEEEGDENSSSTTLQRKKKKNPGLYCLYYLVYPGMHDIPRFKHCSSANMSDKGDWKSHFSTHHSPAAKRNDRNSEKHAKFYMSDEKFEAIMETFLVYRRRKPRDSKERSDHLNALFDEVWFTIFPKHEFPDLKKPLSPFHLVGGEIADLEQHLASRAELLVKTIYEAKADEAFTTGTIGSRSDYRPTIEQTKDIMSKALAIVLLNSPAATGASQWLAHAPLDTIEAAGRQHRDSSVSRALNKHVDEQAVPNGDTHAIPPTPTIVPGMPQLTHGGSATMSTLPVPLLSSGTLLELKPRDESLPQGSTGNAYLSLPSTHYIASTRPVSLPHWSMGTVPMMNQTPYNPSFATLSATDFMPGIDGQLATPVVGGQNGSMQTTPSRPIAPDDWNL